MTPYCLRLTPGQDLKRELDRLYNRHAWPAACVLSGIGSLTRAAIRFADEPSARMLAGPLELLSLGGTLSPQGSHLHLTVAGSDGQVMGGHLKEGATIRTTAEIIVGILDGWEFTRNYDPDTGFPELTPRPVSGAK